MSSVVNSAVVAARVPSAGLQRTSARRGEAASLAAGESSWSSVCPVATRDDPNDASHARFHRRDSVGPYREVVEWMRVVAEWMIWLATKMKWMSMMEQRIPMMKQRISMMKQKRKEWSATRPK